MPVNNHQSMPQQIPNNQRVVYMSNNGSVQGMGTKVSGFNFPKYWMFTWFNDLFPLKNIKLT